MMTLSKWERGLVRNPNEHKLRLLERLAEYPENFIMHGNVIRETDHQIRFPQGFRQHLQDRLDTIVRQGDRLKLAQVIQLLVD
jgi:hypothetical protein